jgi:hypothetical protein
MDRRDFFKTIFVTPLLAPFLLGSHPSVNDELFLISDNPEIYLPSLLEEIGYQNKVFRQSYSVPSTHPRKTALSKALTTSGWTIAAPLQKADLTLSFRPLQHPAPPSFTLVKSGQILDIRKKELFSLWQEMNGKYPPSSCLTVATLKAGQPHSKQGNSARIYMDGHVVEEIPLNKNRTKTFSTNRGSITVKIELGKVFVPSSSCRHKICCSAHPVSISGERIVCAPNHFLLEIQGAGMIDTIIG